MIRQIFADDLVFFKNIRLEALRSEPDAFCATLKDWQDLSDQQWLQYIERSTMLIAFEQGNPVGMMALFRETDTKRRHRASIKMVYLNKSQRGNGTASAMLNCLIDLARQQGVTHLDLKVNAANTSAVRFYQREKFEQVDYIAASMISNGEVIDDMLMSRHI
ncbi:Mycothiol acetyltransferase [Pseudovibrio axinellae]|uniref:Mycothiol acetyltransferase n=2 Tax=Pseudovibrio axinellae TaxID=989403 RepID=A0A166ACV4_9HYPH|nr:Mycothiol acetyltransferase [Pseudovibrio axinellae]SER19919.1 Acetyltransferase, GNAT family [Pseudovibrio axinellae]